MDKVQKFISENQHQLGYIIQEASRLLKTKDIDGALTVGECNFFIEKHGQYHEILEKVKRYEKALEFYADGKTYELSVEILMGAAFPRHEPIKYDRGEKARQALKGESE